MSFGFPKLPRGLKVRGHSNGHGLRQIKRGKTTEDVKRMARQLGLKYRPRTKWRPDKDWG